MFCKNELKFTYCVAEKTGDPGQCGPDEVSSAVVTASSAAEGSCQASQAHTHADRNPVSTNRFVCGGCERRGFLLD